MSKTPKNSDLESIPLLRGGGIVSSLPGCLGCSLKETRLTAFLGYLIALAPEKFLEAFEFQGDIRGVSLETAHADGRSDILVKTTKGTGIIEAKIDAANPWNQCMQYPANWRVLLTQYTPSKRDKTKNVKYIHWQNIGQLLNQLQRSLNPKVKFISAELKNYLEEYHMIRSEESVEIYARDINKQDTLLLFLKAQLYFCNYEKNSRLPEALYFAPHFCKSVSDEYPGIHVGISYISRIEKVEVIESRSDLESILQIIPSKNWLSEHEELLKPICNEWREAKSFLFLGEPRLVFNPPILKNHIQKGSGCLSKRFMSFDDLFAAWEGKLLKA
jgi:hypothetical protein